MIRIWDLLKMNCIAVGDAHSDSVVCVKFSKKMNYFVSGSDDKTIKIWDIKQEEFNKQLEKEIITEKEILQLQCKKTTIAHSKEISSIDTSPDESLIASASSDKTVKV